MPAEISRRRLLAAAAATCLLAACGPGAPKPLHVVEFGSSVVKVFIDGQSAISTITTTIPDGGGWSGNINGVSLAVQSGRLSISGRPYEGPAFSELHVFIKQGGAIETRIAKAKS